MRWENKGHEYDNVYKNMSEKEDFYLFGAGDYGTQFIKIFGQEINIVGYIDNDVKKQGKIINQRKCYGLNEIVLEKNQGIIITMAQWARVAPLQQLDNLGLKYNEDYFIIEEFIAIYNVYKYDKVYFPSISFLPSTVCNLNCKYCLNFNPYAKKFYSRGWEELVADVDTFFMCVDHIMLFHVSGGEPMIYKYTADIIQYIDKNYGDRIDTLRTVTNGTIIPSDEILEKLSKCNIEITVDDYREEVPEYKENFDILLQKLNQYHIRHYINKVDSWIDLAPDRTDYSNLSEEQLIKHRNSCTQSWQELREGKLYSCNYAAYATVAGIAGSEDIEETYNLKSFSNNQKKELIEFRLGYTTKGYTNFCKQCRGFTTNNTDRMVPAEQIKKGNITYAHSEADI